MTLQLRAPQLGDLEQIVAVYNDVMASTFAIWREEPTTVAERAAWLEHITTQNHPAVVAIDGPRLLGFAAAGPFRPWPGYAASWEHSIHVAGDVRARGTGSVLISELETQLRARDAHVMIAGIDAENLGSLRFHARHGFSEVARMPEVGRLRGSWRDLVLVQKILGHRDDGPDGSSSATSQATVWRSGVDSVAGATGVATGSGATATGSATGAAG